MLLLLRKEEEDEDFVVGGVFVLLLTVLLFKDDENDESGGQGRDGRHHRMYPDNFQRTVKRVKIYIYPFEKKDARKTPLF